MSRDGVTTLFEGLFPTGFHVPGDGIVIGALVFLISFASMLFIAHRLRSASRPHSSQVHDFASDAGIVFQFVGQNCAAMTPSAQAFLGDSAAATPWGAIIAKFKDHGLEAALIDLTQSGQSFRQILRLGDGTFHQVEGQPVHGVCEVTIFDITQNHVEKLKLEADLAQSQQELSHACKVLQGVPALAWIQNPDDSVIWSNSAYNMLCQPCATDPDAPQPHQFRPADLHRLQQGEETRLAAFDPEGGARWYTVTKTFVDADQTLFVGVSASKTIDAEETLHRFICTLTETFAHIPIGLAVFDADRSLSMFNPALSELLSIDPAWLAARPDFIGFLERLREQRKMPEARDFVSWREKVNAIDSAAREGEFCEDWDLPGGQTLRVTGSPHPKGAMALLFEDISIAKSLEQKYRTQIDLSETILATLSEGVAVFDTAGALMFSNPSFEAIWGFDPKALADAPTIHDVKTEFETRSQAHTLFAKALDFATHTGQRTNWRAQFDTNDSKTLLGQFAPLPDGSTLMAFLDVTKGGATLGEITSAYSQLLVERQNERDLVELSLEHLKSFLARQDRSEAHGVRAALGDKLSMMEGLLWGASASSDPTVASDLEMGDLSSAFATGRSRGLDISIKDSDLLQEVFELAGIGPNFLNSVLVLVGALVATGGTARLSGRINENSAGLSVYYMAQNAPDIEERRFSLVVALLRELALKHDVGLTFEPGKTEGSIDAAFNFPLAKTELRRLSSQIA